MKRLNNMLMLFGAHAQLKLFQIHFFCSVPILINWLLYIINWLATTLDEVVNSFVCA